MNTLLWGLLLWVFMVESQQSSDRYCNQTIQCANQTINNLDGRLYCQGYLACAKSIINARDVTCSGDQACRESPDIYGERSIWCRGRSSCYGSKRVFTPSGLRCPGAFGCAWIPELTSTTFGVVCNGYYACLHANIIASGVMYIESVYYSQSTRMVFVFEYIYIGIGSSGCRISVINQCQIG